RHAVELHRAADEEAVADVPRVLAPLAEDRQPRGAAELEALALVEDVLLQLLPVFVAVRENLTHEPVEVRLLGSARADGEPGCQRQRAIDPGHCVRLSEVARRLLIRYIG